MNSQYLIEAYAASHDGRTRRHYVMATSANDAMRSFREEYPERVVRSVWKHVPPAYYSESSTEDKQESNP